MSSRSLKAAAASNNDVLTIDQLRHQDDWVLDTERYRCHVCTRNFTRFRRKHHCRKVRLGSPLRSLSLSLHSQFHSHASSLSVSLLLQ